MNTGFHVSKGLRYGWQVRRSGRNRAQKVFQKKSQAIGYARRLARGSDGVLWVHAADGRVVARNDYGMLA